MKNKFFLTIFTAAILFAACNNGSSSDNSELINAFLKAQQNQQTSGSGSSTGGTSGNNTDGSSENSTSTESSLFEFCGDKNYKSEKNAEASAAANQSSGLEDDWWKKTSFYHIWMKSFNDSDGDGCGDFKGVTAKLDYIQNEVGCDGIWLSPIFECSYKSKDENANMHGYDTVDYYAVNDYFGTEADLIELINACHARGMKIIFDFVPNHTSTSNQWFLNSASGTEKKDWYMWSSNQLSWNNGMGTIGCWYKNIYKDKTGYYYGAFGSGMPDLNFRNYEVREEMKNVVRYWLNKGFDGLRADAVRYLIETKSGTSVNCFDTDESHSWFKELRAELDKYSSPKFMMAEAWIEGNRTTFEKYLGNEDEFNMLLDFDQGKPCTIAVKNQADTISSSLHQNKTTGTGFATFMVNHDDYNDRPGKIFTGDEKLQKLATSLSLIRPTVPVIYYGTEIGMKQLNISGDSRLRGKFDWNLEAKEAATENSLLKCNKAINALRKAHKETFANGNVQFLTSGNSKVLAYTISTDNEKLLCVFNLGRTALESVSLSGSGSFSSVSCLIGDTEAPLPSSDGSSIIVKNIAPCAYRVYVLDKTESNYFDDETYVAGETYTQQDNGSVIQETYSTMYIRGTFNKWGGTKMNAADDGWFQIDLTFDSAQTIQFKFCTSDSDWSKNWGDSNGNNIVLNVTSGTYTISFSPIECMWKYEKKQN